MSSRLLWDLSSVLSGTVRLVARSIEAQASRSTRQNLDSASRAAAAWRERREDDVVRDPVDHPLHEAAPIAVASPFVQHRRESAAPTSTGELHRKVVAEDAAAKASPSEAIEALSSRVLAASESPSLLLLSTSLLRAQPRSPSPPPFLSSSTHSPLPVTGSDPSTPTTAVPSSSPTLFPPFELESGELEAIPEVLQVRSFGFLLVPQLVNPFATQAPRHMQASKVPSTRIGRLFHYGGEISLCATSFDPAHCHRTQVSQRG